MLNMKWITVKNISLLATIFFASAVPAADQKPLNSRDGKSINFPESYDYPMPRGAGYETALKCRICHSFGYVLNQGKQSRFFWEHVTHKMVDVYKAPITPDEEKIIADYLYTHYGNGKEK